MLYQQTGIQEIRGIPALEKAGLRLLVKREDQNHPEVSGNKWWKLKYNLSLAAKNQQALLTFGGAWSNHIYATAAAAAAANIRSIGVIRGEPAPQPSPTLSFAAAKGMHLHHITRSAYRQKTTPAFIDGLRQQFGNFHLVPEGGSNALALKGCAEFAREVLMPLDFDRLFLPVGTGGTLAGIAAGFNEERRITGVAVLKGADFLRRDIDNLTMEFGGRTFNNWSLLTQYHLGGYAKTSREEMDLIRTCDKRYQLPLDHVYNAKVLMAILAEAGAGNFRRGDTILMLHTGGLQGSRQVFNFKSP